MNTSDIGWIICSLVLIVWLFVMYLFGYWARRNVPYLGLTNQLIEMVSKMFPKTAAPTERHSKVYQQLAPHKFGGYFKFHTPVLFIRDPDVIKNIITKDFNHFMNRDCDVTNESQALFNLPGERWKALRAKLTPFFRPGKMKVTFTLMKECVDELVNVINDMLKENETIDMKEMMNRFTIDVFGSCIFGLQSNTLKNPDSIFQVMGKKVFSMTLRSPLSELLSVVSPKLRWLVKQSISASDVKGFFESIIINTLEYREQNNVHRSDFVDTLAVIRADIRNPKDDDETKSVLTEKLIIAQGFTFFVAGYETSSGTLTYALYELAKNRKIQARVYDEVVSVLKENNDELTYDTLQQMTYLEQVVNETLRLYPVLPSLDRICNQSYQLTDNYTVEVGTRLKISILGLHTDPQYYNNPNEFNPENFSKEVKTERHHYTYLPFGEGPRMCIGMRFGIMQVKLGLAVLIKNYDISLSRQMEGQLKFHTKSFGRILEGGVYLTFSKRVQ